MSVMGSLLINSFARQKVAMNRGGQVGDFRQHLAPQGRLVVATSGHPARGTCSLRSSVICIIWEFPHDLQWFFCRLW